MPKFPMPSPLCGMLWLQVQGLRGACYEIAASASFALKDPSLLGFGVSPANFNSWQYRKRLVVEEGAIEVNGDSIPLPISDSDSSCNSGGLFQRMYFNLRVIAIILALPIDDWLLFELHQVPKDNIPEFFDRARRNGFIKVADVNCDDSDSYEIVLSAVEFETGLECTSHRLISVQIQPNPTWR
ncbi:hypothetical protein DFH09DRAFT_1073268 [Mycena vulgaris]|nr:hypothetical protein DFH09DRAFT_1073268 [Mycena vulgaris]